MNETGSDTHSETVKWLHRSAQQGHQWFVCLDEYGHGKNGVKTDSISPDHDEPRKNCLWPNLMAGGAGVEWYFGYQFPHNDLHCEDFRSRDHMWDITRYAVDFFHTYLPFSQMQQADELTSTQNDYCFAKPGQIYAVYLPTGGTTKLNLGNNSTSFVVKWYDPRNGGQLQNGSIETITDPGNVSLGTPPNHPDSDWVVLVKKAD